MHLQDSSSGKKWGPGLQAGGELPVGGRLRRVEISQRERREGPRAD